jgi:heat shock protein HslJ
MNDRTQLIKHGYLAGALLIVALLMVSIAGGVLAQDTDVLTLDILNNTTWTLVAHGDPNDPQVVLPDSQITATFDLDESKVSGDAGCNNYFAGFELDGGTIAFSPIASTMMACVEEDRMEQEQRFLTILEMAESYAILDGTLSITAGEQILVFVSQIGLQSTVWTLIEYGNSDVTEVEMPDNQITAIFDLDEGKVSGDAGCNNYFAGFELDGSAITFLPIASTEMACEKDLMEREQDFLAILQTAESYAIINGQLLITAADIVLVFLPQSEVDSSKDALIIITAPQSDAQLDSTQPVHVAGIGRGLFEGNVVIQVIDAEGNLLIEQPTTAQGENVGVGAAGSWSIDLAVDVEPGTTAQITAFSQSPRDGSLMASDRVVVTFAAE